MPDVHSQKRVLESVLSKQERTVLLWLAARTPTNLMPDHLTLIGIMGSIMIFLGYALTGFGAGYLWLATLGFIVNWYGDSMDGTLARYRKIERPKFGFYVDHVVDSFSQWMIFVGLGLSIYVRLDVACLALAGYLLLSITAYVLAFVTGEFRISYARLGPTEVRIIAIAINTLIFFFGNPEFELFNIQFSAFDGAVLAIAALLMTVFTYTSIRSARNLVGIDRQ